MISRTSLGRSAQVCLRKQCRAPSGQCRGLAAVASGSFSYETGDASGLKFASRDLPGPTTTLAVIARAGTRFEPLPAFTEGLEKYAFKATSKRSALRITRESELLGGQLNAYHSRENLVLSAQFLREDLPYFAELLGEVVSKTSFKVHEFDEQVLPNMKITQTSWYNNPLEQALDSAHGLAFHRGLGNPILSLPSPSATELNPYNLQLFSQVAYAKSNFAVVANGANHSELSKWVNEFFKDVPSAAPSGVPSIVVEQSKYHGGEERVPHTAGNAMILGFPGSSSFTGGFWKPEIAVLAALLGGQSTIKWSPGFSLLGKAAAAFPGASVSTSNAVYSDAGLLYVALTGNAEGIKSASQEVVKTIKAVASGEINKELFQKAVATAKFTALESGQNIAAGLELTGAGLVHGGKAHQIDEVGKSIASVTESQLKTVAKTLLEGKAVVSAVGNLHVLPYAEEIGLKV